MAHERFYSATDKLMNAFMTNSISHSSCERCAVGNIVGNGEWIVAHNGIGGIPKELVDDFILLRTGYKTLEIYEIEKAFEQRSISRLIAVGECRLDSYNDWDGFKGLCNVFDKLIEFEDWEDESKINLIEILQTQN